MNIEPVVIVHGTFAQESDWFLRDSVFCKTLNDQLRRRGSAAECWSHLERESGEFRWSGANSELERRLAAWDFQEVLATLEHRSDVDGYHIISHSHGGNVVMNALGLVELKKLRTATFLGCPFIETRSRIGYLLTRSIVIFLMVVITSSVLGLVRPDIQTSFDFFSYLLIAVSIWFTLSAYGSVNALLMRYNLRKKYQTSEFKCFAMFSKYDEAYAALAASLEVAERRSYYAKMLMGRYVLFPRIEHWYFRLLAVRPIYTLSGSRQVQSFARGVRTLQRKINTALGTTIGVMLLPLTLAFYSARYLGIRIGLGALASMATGDDLSRERIRSFARQPLYLTATDLEIPALFDDELKNQAIGSSSETLHSLYELLSTPTNVAEVVRKTLTDPYLVHSQYYKHEQLICQIARAISGK